jgi:hypothetical protein
LALGLIERDGLFVCAGAVLGFCGLAFNLFVGSSIIRGAILVFERAVMSWFA